MTLPTDSGEPLGGVQGEPTPATSQGASVQPDSSGDVDALVARLLKNQAFSAALDRAAQSQKDRRFTQLEQKVKSFAEQLAEYDNLTESGFPKPAAIRIMQMGEQLEQLLGSDSPTSAPVGDRGAGQSVNFSALLETLGLPDSDPEVTAIIRDGSDYASKVNRFAMLAKNRQSQKLEGAGGAPNPGTVLPSGGAAPPTPKPDLESQYLAELKEIRQGDVTAISELKKKYRKLGLQVY